MKTSTYWVSTAKGLEDTLQNELKEHNIHYRPVKIRPQCFEFKALPTDAFRLTLNLGSASRITEVLHEFTTKDERDFYKKLKKFDWTKFFSPHKTFKVRCTTSVEKKPKSFKNTHYIAQLTKDAICDTFQEEQGTRPSIDLQNPDLVFSLFIRQITQYKYQVILGVEISSAPLSHRGYRMEQGAAPLRENLAYTIAKKILEQNPEQEHFIDSMCGSGTFLIEVCQILLGLTPSHLIIKKALKNNDYPWSFFHSDSLSKKDIQEFKDILFQIHQENMEKTDRRNSFILQGFDIHGPTLNKARENIKAAGLERFIHILKKDARVLLPKQDSGVIFCNPPYGERLGEEEQLAQLYYDYGENLKNNFKGYTAYIFTGNIELRKKISLRTSMKYPLYNGPIECRLLRYDLY